MTDEERDLWVTAVVSALCDVIPQWPTPPSLDQIEAQLFYRLWLEALGYKINFC